VYRTGQGVFDVCRSGAMMGWLGGMAKRRIKEDSSTEKDPEPADDTLIQTVSALGFDAHSSGWRRIVHPGNDELSERP
jgi:hypothetical protein